jgi:hypothetical protein
MKLTAFWVIAPCSFVELGQRFIALMMEAVRISETSLFFYETLMLHIPESCHILGAPI